MSAVLDFAAPAARRRTTRHPIPHPDPSAFAFARDVLAGLEAKQKSIPCTWLYDHRGSELFDAITRIEEYYPARTETWILESCAAQIAHEAGPNATVVELGSGSSGKTPILLRALETPSAYVPIDICEQYLNESVHVLQARFPRLRIAPVVADFTRLTALPELALGAPGGRRVVFFPGSTIGNFAPDTAVGLLTRIGQAVGPDALLIVGADATLDPDLLIPAYADAKGATAAFNGNLLTRINRELGADFSPSAFGHEARYNAREQRVEMHLVSRYTQRVSVLGRSFMFGVGESIHTENSYKYSLVKFRALAQRAGWAHQQLWMDGRSRFAVHVLERVR